MTNRKNQRTNLILDLIIEQYLIHGEPVSSKFVAEDPNVSASPATVRNVMCELERQGLIYSPHTSAGRIPTQLGLRSLVDNILANFKHREGALQKVEASFDNIDTPDDGYKKAVKLLSDMTQLTALALVPRINNMVVKQVELVRLADRRLLCVLIDQHDQIQSRVVELTFQVNDDQIQKTLQLLNTALAGFSMAEGAKRLAYLIKQTEPEVAELVRHTLFGDKLVENDHALFVSGELNLLNPEISTDTETLKRVIQLLQQSRSLMSLFASCQAGEVTVFIGRESGYELLANCSLIVKPVTQGNRKVGYLALIGPSRLDYHSVINAVDMTSNIISSALNRTF